MKPTKNLTEIIFNLYNGVELFTYYSINNYILLIVFLWRTHVDFYNIEILEIRMKKKNK